jgi:segregation and condensation protein B
MTIEQDKLKNIIEAALFAVAKPMSVEQILKLFADEEQPSANAIREMLRMLQNESSGRGVELIQVGSGFRYQAREDYSEWLSRLWDERPAKYSRAALETLALIAYRQPVTRGEIEDVRGVGVSSSIIKTMLEREWIRIVGHRDVPGRPALYATTRQFLDYFNMKSLEELPTLAEIKDLDDIHPELDLPDPDENTDLDPDVVTDTSIETTLPDMDEQNNQTDPETRDFEEDDSLLEEPHLEEEKVGFYESPEDEDLKEKSQED